MMGSHLLALVYFSALVSFVLALLHRDDPAARWRFGLRVFAAMVGGAIIVARLLGAVPA